MDCPHVFVLLFAFITYLGFAAAHWRKGDLDQLHEWGLGGRRFGTLITWFLVGGDIYTAYTFIAVPALAFGAGAIAFFAVPYTIFIYPILFLVFPRLWNVCHKHNYITPADFVRGRFGNRWLALGDDRSPALLRRCPISRCNWSACRSSSAPWACPAPAICADLPLLIAFVILAAFTYSSGLRAPASIAIVKDILIYITAIAAVDHHSVAARRLRQDFRSRAAGEIVARRARAPTQPAPMASMRRWRSARRWRCFCTRIPITGILERIERARHPPQRRDVAGLFLHARPADAGRLLCHRRRRLDDAGICRRLQAVRQQFRGAGAVPAQLPVMVCRRRLRRGRHRRAGAGGDHVDRRGQSLHPQYPSRVLQQESDRQAKKRRWRNGCR